MSITFPFPLPASGFPQAPYVQADLDILLNAINNGTGLVTSITGTANQITASGSTGAVTLSLPSSISITGTTNQLVLGTTRTATITAPTPATSSRVYTFPDLVGDYSVVGTIGAQSIAGVKTFTSNPIVSLADDARLSITDTGDSSTLLFRSDGSNSSIGTSTNHKVVLQTNSTTAISITTAQEITQPLQPSFLVTNSAGATDVTGNGTVYTVLWGNEIYDQNADFASNTFTAPVTGRYLLSATVTLENILVGHNGKYIEITTTARNYRQIYGELLAMAQLPLSITVIADMTAGDTAVVNVYVDGSTKTVDILASALGNYFSGSLIN